MKGLSAAAPGLFELDVLRPPTYEQLARVLRDALDGGRPYHIVHFDGHGAYAAPRTLEAAGRVLNSYHVGASQSRERGYLVFEAPEAEHNATFVDGTAIGQLLAETSVPVLVLNARQSAYALAAAVPHGDAGARSEVAGYGSLAQEVIDAGSAGVVAMRYSVYAVTAAQFVAELYAALAHGLTLGEAVTRARKNLAENPYRQVAYDPRPLQDWCVPIIYERTQMRLWTQPKPNSQLRIDLAAGAGSVTQAVDRQLPPPPDVGFFGRDETLYALDRAFDIHNVVLLHAYAGSGKTSTTREFARWYLQTGSIEAVLFSSFERHLPLTRLLDKIGDAFARTLEQNDVRWDTITNVATKSHIALQLLAQLPSYGSGTTSSRSRDFRGERPLNGPRPKRPTSCGSFRMPARRKPSSC